MDDEEKIIDPAQASAESDPPVAEEPAPIAESEEMPVKTIRRNTCCIILMDCMFVVGWQGGIKLALLPLLAYLDASNTQVGLITGASLAVLPGIFLTPFITRLFPYKKWYFFLTNLFYILPLGLIGAMVLLSGKLNLTSAVMLSIMLILMLMHWFFGGFISIPRREFITSCVPGTHRGRLTGFTATAAGGLSIGSAAVGGLILHHIGEPRSFAYLFLLGWLVIQSGYFSVFFAKEKRTPVELSPKPWSKAMLQAFWQDKNYLKFTIVQIILTLFMGTNVMQFINYYGFHELKMAAATAAVMTIIDQAIRFGGSIPGGILADKLNPRRIIFFCMLLGSFSMWPVILMQSAMGIYLTLALIAISGVAAGPVWAVLGYGLPKPEHRAGHFSISAILGMIAGALGGMIAGVLGDLFSLRAVFVGMSVVSFIMVFFTQYMMKTFPDSTKDLS